jgi:WD40 repeat protein
MMPWGVWLSGRAVPFFSIAVAACSFDSSGLASDDHGSQTTDSEAGTTPTTSTSASTDSTLSTSGADATTEVGTSSGGDATTSTTTGEGGSTSTSDGGSSSGDSGEGPPEFGPFDDGVPVTELNSDAFDDDPSLRGDLLEIYFASTRLGGEGSEEIWRSERASIDDPWDDPVLVDGLGSPGQDGWPELSHDGLWLTFGSDRGNVPGDFDIYVVSRATVDSAWSAPMTIAELTTGLPEAAAVVDLDRLEVMIASPIGVGDDIYRATRDSVDSPFGALARVDELNSFLRDSVPFIDYWGTRVLFASDRGGEMAIWTAQRDPGMAFAAPEAVADVDGMGAEDDPWWARDGSVLYFARLTGTDGLDIYVATQSQ